MREFFGSCLGVIFGLILLTCLCVGGCVFVGFVGLTNSGKMQAATASAEFPAQIKADDLTIDPLSAEVTRLKFGDEQSDEYFVFTVRVLNASNAKRYEFSGWPSNRMMPNCGLRDEHGNQYKVITFPSAVDIPGNSAPGTLEPGQSKVAVVPFEKPIEAATHLTVLLERSGIGRQRGGYQWQIKREQWTH